MKKLVLVAALFMFVCGGSFVANAQDPVKTQQQQPATEKTEEPKATACQGRTQSRRTES